MHSQHPMRFLETKAQKTSLKPGISTALLKELVSLKDVKESQEKIVQQITTSKSTYVLLWWLSEINNKFFNVLPFHERKSMLMRQKKRRDQLNQIQEMQLSLILNAFINPSTQRIAIDDLFRYYNINSIMTLVLDEAEKDNGWPNRAAVLLTMQNNVGLTVFQQLCNVARLEEDGDDFLFRFLGAVSKSRHGAEALLMALVLTDKEGKSGQNYLDEYWSSKAAANKKTNQVNTDSSKSDQKAAVQISLAITSTVKELDSKTDQASISDATDNERKFSSSQVSISEHSTSNEESQRQQVANSHKKTMKVFFEESLVSLTEEDSVRLKSIIESAKRDKKSSFHRLPHKMSFLYRMFSISRENNLTLEYVLRAINMRLKVFEDAYDEQFVRIHDQPSELQPPLSDSFTTGMRAGRIHYQ